MKNKLWSLYLSLLNVHYGWSAAKFRYFRQRKRLWEPILLILVFIPLGIGLIKFLSELTEAFFLAGLGLGQPHLALVYGAVAVSVLTFFFGFFSVLSAFYFSNDLETLVPLPLKAWEILLAKLAVVLTGQYLINALILLPIWLKYAALAQVKPGFWLTAVPVFLFLPLIPLLAASAICLLLMRAVNLSRHKDKLTFVGGVLVVGLSFGFQFWLQNNIGDGDLEAFLNQVLTQTDGLVRLVGRIFPSSVWAAQAMAYIPQGKGWLNLAYLCLSGLIGLVFLYWLGKGIFFRGLLQGLEGSKGRGKKDAALIRGIKAKAPLVSLVQTELRLFLRDPNYALNGLIGYILIPVLSGLSLLTQELPGDPFQFLAQYEYPASLAMGFIALFVTGMPALSMIPATTFSREGKYLWIMRSLPIPLEQVVLSRVLAAQIINSLGCLVAIVPIAFFLRLSWQPVFFGGLLGLLLGTAWIGLLVFWDLRRPMLDWVSPIKAIKSNLNAVVALAATSIFVFALGFLIVKIPPGKGVWLVPAIILAASFLLGAVSFYLVKRLGGKIWSRIEGGI